jgi:hypothetical protein
MHPTGVRRTLAATRRAARTHRPEPRSNPKAARTLAKRPVSTHAGRPLARRDLSLEVATPAEARAQLQLKGGDMVGF